MSALVVYESMFGNTKRVAEAVADGLAGSLPVEIVEVSNAPTELPTTIELLVVGGPTHVHGMTTTRSRLAAEARMPGARISQGIGIREWLEAVRPEGHAAAASFDTRINAPAIFTGSAASGFARRLRRAGFRLLTPTASFLIDTKSPQDDSLLDGEVEKASAWGRHLADRVRTPALVG